MSAAIKLVRRVRETGSTEPVMIGGYRKPLVGDHGELLLDLTTAKPGITWRILVRSYSRAGSRLAA